MASVAAPRSRSAKMVMPADHYAGWLHNTRPTLIPCDSYRVENFVNFGIGWAELWRCKWSRTIEATWQTAERCYFLSLVLDGLPEGERRNLTLARPTPYSGTRVSMVPPDQTMHSVGSAGELRSMRCFIDAEFLESICSTKPTAEERAQLGAIDFGGTKIEWLLFRMYREISNAEIGMAAAVEGLAREIAVEIVRMIERRRLTERHHSGGLPSWRMRLLLDRIYGEGPLPNVAELAGICGMTVRHLGRAFQAETGKTIGKFIASAMAERAYKMLEAGVPIGAVAAILGYASSSSFAYAFHRETGVLPSRVKTMLGGGRAD